MNENIFHIDQARQSSLEYLENLLRNRSIQRALLIEDLFGRMRPVVWSKSKDISVLKDELKNQFEQIGGQFWSGDVWIAPGQTKADEELYEGAWAEGRPVSKNKNLRINHRFRSRGAWLRPRFEPPWPLDEKIEGRSTPIVAFYSFKGGVGRSTALSSFAINRARLQERVVVIDLDLDAPGLGILFTPKGQESAAYGVVDYFLEQPVLGEVNLDEYRHIYTDTDVIGLGQIYVIPAGISDENYPAKLAHLDLELPELGSEHPLQHLLLQVREKYHPDWILLDLRAGMAEIAGLAMNGLAHLYVLFGTLSPQSWQGQKMVIEMLGKDRWTQQPPRPQRRSIMVQSMVPEIASESITADFRERAKEIFKQVYYAPNPKGPAEEGYWYMHDVDNELAPHAALKIEYSPKLATLKSLHIDDTPELKGIIEKFDVGDYKRLHERILKVVGGE